MTAAANRERPRGWRPLTVVAGMWLAGCVGSVMAGDVDGVWNLDPEGCGQPVSETRLRISGSEFEFHEARCRMTPRGVGPDAITALLDCNGEGELFQREVALRRIGDLLELTENGSRLVYHLCRG